MNRSDLVDPAERKLSVRLKWRKSQGCYQEAEKVNSKCCLPLPSHLTGKNHKKRALKSRESTCLMESADARKSPRNGKLMKVARTLWLLSP